MSKIPTVENDSDSSTESERLSSDAVNTPDDFITASEGPSLFEIVGLLLSSDSSQDNLKLCETSQPPKETSEPPNETSLNPIETSLAPNETSKPPNKTSLPPDETLPDRTRTSFPPVSCDKKVSFVVSEGTVQIKPCTENDRFASVDECRENQPKQNCTNVEIEILRALAVYYTSLPSQNSTHQDVTLQVLSGSKNINLPEKVKDRKPTPGHSDAETAPAVASTKTNKQALPIVQAIHETVDQETLEIIKKNLKDRVAEKQLFEPTQSRQKQQFEATQSRPKQQLEATQSRQQQQQQPIVKQEVIVPQEAAVEQEAVVQEEEVVQPSSARISSQSSDDGEVPAVGIPVFYTEPVVPRDNVYFDTFKLLETLVEEESTSELALNKDDDGFNTFEGYLKNEVNVVDIATLLKDQFIDKATFRKILSNYLKNKRVLYDAICDINKSRIKQTSEESIISRKSGPVYVEGPTVSTTITLEEPSINYKSEGEVIEIDSRAKSQQRGSIVDEELSTYDIESRKEFTRNRNDDEILKEIQCTIPRDPPDLCFTLSENKCIEKISIQDVSVRQPVQGQYLPDDGLRLKDFANFNYKDDVAVLTQPLSTAIQCLEPSCDISLINNIGSYSYDCESARKNSVNLTAEQVHITALEVDVSRFGSEQRKDVPRDEIIDKQERVEPILQNDSELNNAAVAKHKEDNAADDNVKEGNGILDKIFNIKEVEVKRETVNVENVIVVNSTVGNSIELACSLKTEGESFKANLSVKESSTASIEQGESFKANLSVKETAASIERGISLKDSSVGKNKETSLSIDTTRTNSSKNTLEVSLIYKTINALHQKMNETTEKEPILQKEPTIQEEPIIQREEPILQKEPTIQEEPIIQREPIIQKEPITREEPIVQKEPILQKEPVTQEEPVKKKLSIEPNQLENTTKVTVPDAAEVVLATSVADIKKLFEQKPIMMPPPSIIHAYQDEPPKPPIARQVNQPADSTREVNQSATTRENNQSAATARVVNQPASTAPGVNQSDEKTKLPRKEEQERRSSMKKEILRQIAQRSDSDRASIASNDPAVKVRLEENKPANVQAKFEEPGASQAEQGSQPRSKSGCAKRSHDHHCSQRCYRRDTGSEDHSSIHCSERNHPRHCGGASSTRNSESQTVAQNCPYCGQPEPLSNSCCSRNASHHHHCPGQPCEQLHSSCPGHRYSSESLDQSGPCSFRASSQGHHHQRDVCHASCVKPLTEKCPLGRDNKSCLKQIERRKSSHREDQDHSCGQHCCHCHHSTKCPQEDSQHCTEDATDDLCTETDRSVQTATDCFTTKIDANYTAIRICFKPNGKMKLCPEDCSCRDYCTPDTSKSLASEVCIEATYAHSDSTISVDTGSKKIKFSSQCDLVNDDDSDEERTGESRV